MTQQTHNNGQGHPNLPPLEESAIRRQAAAESFSRGQQYERRGAVVSMVLRGSLLQAEVEGTQHEPYRVRVSFDDGGIVEASCSCPYDWGGWCKHIVAVLLTASKHPEQIEVRPALEQVLGVLERDQLRDLLLRLARRDADLADAIELHASLLQNGPRAHGPQPAVRRPAVSAETVRRQVRGALRAAAHDEDDALGAALEQLDQTLQQARDFVEAGDGRNALTILSVLTGELLKDWEILGGDDGSYRLLEELGVVWTEAILSTDLSRSERDELVEQLESWADDVRDYDLGQGFEMAATAADQGWDAPALRRVLAGQFDERGAWDDEAPDFADDLALIRLGVLERQKRYDEYLYLAEAEGQVLEFTTMLARTGQTRQAVEEGLRHFTTAAEALSLARALRASEDAEGALKVAERGLAFAEPRGELAAWLAEAAESAGRHDLALHSADVAFRSEPGLQSYQRVRRLAGASWPGMRTMLLDFLRRAAARRTSQEAAVDVFLHEGLVEDAIQAVQGGTSAAVLEQVMDAALTRYPDWVVQAALAQAEWIVDNGQSQHYDDAVAWLRRARDAYRAASRPSEWHAYLREIRTKHGRKHKLMALLQKL